MFHLSFLLAELRGPPCIDLEGQEAERDMKMFLGILSGFSVTLAAFAAGALTAIFFVNAEPVPARSLDLDTTALWTNKAVSVNTPARDLDAFLLGLCGNHQTRRGKHRFLRVALNRLAILSRPPTRQLPPLNPLSLPWR
jgi:hypothetical protein